MRVPARAAKIGRQRWRFKWSVAALYRRLRKRFRKMPGLNDGFVIKD